MICAYCNKEITSGNIMLRIEAETQKLDKMCCEECFRKYIATVEGTEVLDIPSGKKLTVTRITK